jgi:hypothetical protein
LGKQFIGLTPKVKNMITKNEVVVPSLATAFHHFLLGLDGGLAIYAVYLWFVGCQMHGKPTDTDWNWALAGLAIPLGLSAGAMALAWWRPLKVNPSWGNIAALVGVLVLLTPVCLFVLLLIAMSGYC